MPNTVGLATLCSMFLQAAAGDPCHESWDGCAQPAITPQLACLDCWACVWGSLCLRNSAAYWPAATEWQRQSMVVIMTKASQQADISLQLQVEGLLPSGPVSRCCFPQQEFLRTCIGLAHVK